MTAPDPKKGGKTFKMTKPTVAARMIIDGIEKNRYQVYIGSDSKMMDLLYRLMPERAAKIIYKQMRTLLKD